MVKIKKLMFLNNFWGLVRNFCVYVLFSDYDLIYKYFYNLFIYNDIIVS